MKTLTTLLLALLVLGGCSKSDLPDCLGEYNTGSWSNCYGERITKNGFSYKGEYKEGLSNGFGELLFPNGGKYKGEFLNGTFHGQGTAWMADGTKQKGEGKAFTELAIKQFCTKPVNTRMLIQDTKSRQEPD